SADHRQTADGVAHLGVARQLGEGLVAHGPFADGALGGPGGGSGGLATELAGGGVDAGLEGGGPFRRGEVEVSKLNARRLGGSGAGGSHGAGGENSGDDAGHGRFLEKKRRSWRRRIPFWRPMIAK